MNVSVSKAKIMGRSVSMLKVHTDFEARAEKLHHILVLDRSGSMTYHINDLVDNVIKALGVISASDLVTIIWYSGPGQHRVLCKGATVNNDLIKLVNSLRDTISTTCFSEPLAEAAKCAFEYSQVVDATWLTIFTDGQPVVPWDERKEMDRAFGAIVGADIVACYAIGYGSYYNREFLTKLAGATEHGEFFHARNIDDFLSLFSKGKEMVGNVGSKSIEIGSIGGQIVYLGSDTVKMSGVNGMSTRLDRGFNVFYLIDPSDTYIDNQRVNLDSFVPMTVDQKEDFLFAYAYGLYRDGRRAEAKEALAEIRSRKFMEQVENVFTNDEVGEFLINLREAVFNNGESVRFPDGVLPKGAIPRKNAFCLLDLIQFLAANKALYVPYGKLKDEQYKRISQKREGSYKLFEKCTDKEATTPFTDLVYNEKAANISIRFTELGQVKLNPVQAKTVGLDPVISCVRFRNHTIVQDGRPNMKTMEVLIPELVYVNLTKKAPAKLIIKVDTEPDGLKRVLLDLTSIPVINKLHQDNTSLDHLAEQVYTLNVCKAVQKVLNWYLDLPIVGVDGQDTTLSQFTPEQEKLLSEHGLSNKLVYSDIDAQLQPSGDSYQTRYMAFKLEGASFPKVTDIIDRQLKGKKLEGYQDVMATTLKQYDPYLVPINHPDGDYLKLAQEGADKIKARLFEVKDQIRTASHALASVRIVKVLSGDWFPGLAFDAKGNGTYDSNYGKLTITAERKEIFL